MANEFKHKVVGSELSQTEYESTAGHVFDSQATGDILYATNSTQLSRLGIGSTNDVLTIAGGVPAWDSTWSPAGDITLADTVDLLFGTGADAGFRWSTGDASNHSLVLGLDNTGQQLHITDQGAIATDWARSAGTHPEVSIHSNTTPATDYLAIGNHDGTTASIDVVGGTTLDLRIAGTDELQITAAGINTNGGTITGTTISATLLTASTSLALATGATVTGIDNGSLGSSATLLATQGAIKTYVDAQQDTVDTLAEILALANTTGGTDIIMTDGDDLNFGSGGDIMLRHSGAVSANAEVTTIIAGTSVHPGVAADSLLVSNITASGDIMFATNRGGNTEAHALFDASAGDTLLYARGVEAVKIAGGGAVTITPALTVSGLITANGGITFAAGDDIAFTGSTGTNDITLTDSLADALSITRGGTDMVVFNSSTPSITFTPDVTISGSLTVNGTTTTVDTATLAVVDPIIHLQTASDGGALGSDTNKDVGLALQYYTDAAKTAFLGYDDSAGRLTFVKEASLSSEVISGTLGDLDIGGIYATDVTLDGDKSVTPGDGAVIHVDAHTITDSNTSGSGTAAKFTHVAIEAPTLAATNASVTTSDAATFYISGTVAAGTNQTLTRPWAMWVDAGNARFDGSIYSGTTEAINSSGLVQVANQSAITGLGTLSSIDIDGGAIDGAVIGANSAAAITGTTVDAGTDFTIGDTVITDGVITDTSGLQVAAAVDLVANTLTTTGSLQVRTIDYSDGDLAMTIADGGGVTFAQASTFTGGLTANGDIAIADGKVIKLGGSRPADDEPATANNTGYGVVVLFDAGAAVAIGDAVSIGTDGRVIKTVADATGTLSGPCIGVATTAAGSADDDVYVMTHGVFRHDDWNFGTKGQAVYIEEADPGDLSITAPNDDGDYAQRVGVAITDDVLLVMPSIDVIEHA